MKPHAEDTLIARLAKQPGWTESLTPENRERCIRKVLESLETAEKPRDIATLIRTLAALERSDVDRARLLEGVEATHTEEEKFRLLLERFRAMEQLGGGAPPDGEA